MKKFIIPLVVAVVGCFLYFSLTSQAEQPVVQTVKGYQQSVDVSCDESSQCVVKNVGNCCGYYPACVNKDSVVNPDLVKKLCQKDGLAGVCGFPDIQACTCQSGKCVAGTPSMKE